MECTAVQFQRDFVIVGVWKYQDNPWRKLENLISEEEFYNVIKVTIDVVEDAVFQMSSCFAEHIL